jgi:hypothetical protein
MGDTRITKVAEVRFLKFLAALNRGWWFSATGTVCRILENLQFIAASPDDAERRAGEISPPCRLKHSWRGIAIAQVGRWSIHAKACFTTVTALVNNERSQIDHETARNSARRYHH